MIESFKKHFVQRKEEKSPEPIKGEQDLELPKEIKELRDKPDRTEEDYLAFIQKAEEIKRIFSPEREESKEKESREIFKHLKRLLEQGADKDYVAEGLAGTGTPEAMDLREELLEQGADKDSVAQGLAGVGTPEAMALREKLLEQGANKNYIAQGLAGVGTPEAMALREKLLEQGVDKDSIAYGLAGVNSQEAFEFRNRHFGDNPTLEAKSFQTGWSVFNGVICRYGYEK